MIKELFQRSLVWSCLALIIVGLLGDGCFFNTAGANSTNNVNVTTVQNEKVVEPGSESAAQKREVLWDFRTDNEKPQTFSRAESQAVLKYLFGNSWDQDLEISSRFSGSFTAPHANETLYYIGGCNEDDGQGFKSTANCAHASWWNAGWIAIYNGSTPIVKIEAALGYEVAKVTNVNGDGINEILSLSGYSNQGETETSASLGQISNGKYQEIKTFSGYADSCGSEPVSAPKAKASVISYLASPDGKMPEFTEEYFQNKCGKTPWKKITKKQFDSE